MSLYTSAPQQLDSTAHKIGRQITHIIKSKRLTWKSVAVVSTIMFSLLSSSSALARNKLLFSDLPESPLETIKADHAKRIAKIKTSPESVKVKTIQIDSSALSGNSIDIPLGENHVATFLKTKIDTQSATFFIWHGKSSTTEDTATFVVNNGNVTGSIRENGKLYKIEPIGSSAHALVDIDENRFQPDHPPGKLTRPPVKNKNQSAADTATRAIPSAADVLAPTATVINGQTHIDVLVVYPSSLTSVVTDVKALATLAVAETNQAYVNSQVNIQMNLVGTELISYSEAGKTYNQMLDDMAVQADIKTKRDALGADVVIMLTTNKAYCGMSWVYPSEFTAHGVVAYNCATGYYSFAHEIGHIQGLNHDPINEPGTYPFAYGHGYQSTNSSPNWRTIMAYNCANGCPRIKYFSNPNVNYNGLAMGTPTVSDNARVLNETAARVSAFRSTVTAPIAPIAPPTVPPTPTWTYCASENQTCYFSGTHQIRYGANDSYNYGTYTGSVACNNAIWGDPKPGVVKSCFYDSSSPTTAPTPAPVVTSTPTWTYCASENQTCYFSGTRQIRYGANDSYNYWTYTGSVACNNATWGDPKPGVVKSCFYMN